MNDREKLIDILESAESAVYWNSDDCGFIEKIADHLIANGVTVQKWIPVSERLPESIINKVLVYCKCGYVCFGHYEKYKGNAIWYNLETQKEFTTWDFDDYEVTHWMPLPTKPKGE